MAVSEASVQPITVVNVGETSAADEPFIDLPTLAERPVTWHRHSGLPQNLIERVVRRPRLSRYRAALAAARDARDCDAIISHLPRMSAAVADAGRGLRSRAAHLAFSFNFTELPTGRTRARLSSSLSYVDQFCVYTRFEAGLYADALKLDAARFEPVTWTQDIPPVGHLPPDLTFHRPYVVAVGGEGRDFATLMEAARATPTLQYVVIARPAAALAHPPANVRVIFNVPLATCWGIASRALALLVPLRDAETCCGHITLVSGRLLGLPILTTASSGTDEYTQDFPGTLTLPAGEPEAWANAIRELMDDPGILQFGAAIDAAIARDLYKRSHWASYVADFLGQQRQP